MHNPWKPCFSVLNRILIYVQGTSDHGLQLYSSPFHDLVTYSNADWAGCPSTMCFTSRYFVFPSPNLMSWYLKTEGMISRSSSKA